MSKIVTKGTLVPPPKPVEGTVRITVDIPEALAREWWRRYKSYAPRPPAYSASPHSIFYHAIKEALEGA